jgi:hypothetical protein
MIRRPSPTTSRTSTTEAKGNGFDVQALRKVVSIRKIDAKKRAEQDAILDTYMLALGMMIQRARSAAPPSPFGSISSPLMPALALDS